MTLEQLDPHPTDAEFLTAVREYNALNDQRVPAGIDAQMQYMTQLYVDSSRLSLIVEAWLAQNVPADLLRSAADAAGDWFEDDTLQEIGS